MYVELDVAHLWLIITLARQEVMNVNNTPKCTTAVNILTSRSRPEK